MTYSGPCGLEYIFSHSNRLNQVGADESGYGKVVMDVRQISACERWARVECSCDALCHRYWLGDWPEIPQSKSEWDRWIRGEMRNVCVSCWNQAWLKTVTLQFFPASLLLF